MPWQDGLQPASFRDVAFSVLGADGVFGRRGQVHEYAGRDEPWVEDLGRRARQWTVDAVVLGADYMAKRDALIAAVEQPGPGKLVHPYYGEAMVSVIDCRVSEATSAGGVARFVITFVEAGKSTWPKQVASTPDQVAAKGEAAQAAADADFVGTVQTKGLPDFVANSLRSRVSGLLTQVRSMAASLRSEMEPLAELQQQIDDINADLVALVYEPAAMVDSVRDAMQQLTRGLSDDMGDVLDLAKTLWGYGTLVVSTSGVSAKRAVEINNRKALARLVRSTAIVEGARAAAKVTFDSFDDAAALRDQFTDAFDELLGGGVSDDAFDALRALRASVVSDITTRGADLARLVRVTPARTQPALLLAHGLYGDSSKHVDVLARNAQRIRHPLFVPGGRELEVLSNG